MVQISQKWLSDWMAELSRQLPSAHFTQVVGVECGVCGQCGACRRCVCVGGGRLSDWMAELSQSQPPSAHFSQVDMGRSEVWGGWLLGSSLCACIGPSARSVRSPSCPIQRVPSNPSGSNPPPDQWPEVP